MAQKVKSDFDLNEMKKMNKKKENIIKAKENFLAPVIFSVE
jgi:hypothetical protein